MSDQVHARFVIDARYMSDSAVTVERVLRPAWLSILASLQRSGLLDDAAEVYVDITARTRKCIKVDTI